MYHQNNREVMEKQLKKNENPPAFKEVIKETIHDVEERVYWFSTSEETQFLGQFYDKQVTGNMVLKNRLKKITDDKLQEFLNDLNRQQKQMSNSSYHGLSVEPELEVSKIIDVPTFNPNYFSPNHPKTKEVQLKLKRINNDIAEFRAKTERIRKQTLEKKHKRSMLEEENRKKEDQEKRKKYRESAQKKIDQQKQEREERIKQHEKFKQFYKVYKQSKPLHVLMEQNYHEKFQLPMLEENKRKLQEYSTKQKPTLQELNEHERNYLEMLQCRDSRISIPHQTIDVSFKSRFYQEQEKKMHDSEYEDPVWDQVEKKKRYSELVKQNFKPKISLTLVHKNQESKIARRSFVKEVPDRSIVVEKGKVYLDYMCSLKKKRKHSSASVSEQHSIQNERPHYKNYLEGLKQSRRSTPHPVSYNWQRDLTEGKGAKFERRERVLLKSKQLEQKALRQEQFVSTQTHNKAVQLMTKKKQIDEALMESIKGKVAVLKDASG